MPQLLLFQSNIQSGDITSVKSSRDENSMSRQKDRLRPMTAGRNIRQPTMKSNLLTHRIKLSQNYVNGGTTVCRQDQSCVQSQLSPQKVCNFRYRVSTNRNRSRMMPVAATFRSTSRKHRRII